MVHWRKHGGVRRALRCLRSTTPRRFSRGELPHSPGRIMRWRPFGVKPNSAPTPYKVCLESRLRHPPQKYSQQFRELLLTRTTLWFILHVLARLASPTCGGHRGSERREMPMRITRKHVGYKVYFRTNDGLTAVCTVESVRHGVVETRCHEVPRLDRFPLRSEEGFSSWNKVNDPRFLYFV